MGQSLPADRGRSDCASAQDRSRMRERNEMTIPLGHSPLLYLGMIQGAMNIHDVTDEIVARIREAVNPWRIVLFGSRARGDHREESDYDFYVEVREDGASLRELHSRIREFVGHAHYYDLKVCPPGEIERRRDDPGTIEWDVAREGRLLFADPAAPQRLAPPKRVAESPAELPESFHEWLAIADKDMRHCLLLRAQDDAFWPDICWYSHQTCEKHMKALLVSRRVRPERTHKLERLLLALRTAGFALPGLDADCKLLTPHGVTARYTTDLGPIEADMAFAAAERITAAIRAELPPSLH
jgi:uncharacterized protein